MTFPVGSGRKKGSKNAVIQNRHLIKQILDMDPIGTQGMKMYHVLDNLGLPRNLISLIETGQLETAIEEAYERTDRLNAMLDDWERENWDIYEQCPWFKAREEWKKEGRPKPPWYQVLLQYENRHCKKGGPIAPADIDSQITYVNVYEFYRKQREEKKKKALLGE